MQNSGPGARLWQASDYRYKILGAPARNISNHQEVNRKQPSRRHQEITASMQKPPRSNSRHLEAYGKQRVCLFSCHNCGIVPKFAVVSKNSCQIFTAPNFAIPNFARPKPAPPPPHTGAKVGQGDRSSYCVPIHRTAQILTQSKNSENELKQTMVHSEDTRLLFSICCCCPMDVAPPGGGWCSGHGKANLLLGAVPMLVWKHPLCLGICPGTVSER